MKHTPLILLALFSLFSKSSFSQDEYIRSVEGKPYLSKRALFNDCLKSLNKTRADETAATLCECRISKLNRKFTNTQFRKHTKAGIVDLAAMINENPVLQNELQECYANTGKTILLQAENYEDDFIVSCIENIRRNTSRRTEYEFLQRFCKCQLEMVKSRKTTDAEMKQLSDPNSVFYYEMLYKCGYPFETDVNQTEGWTTRSQADINGPQADTIPVLTINNMTFVKVKVGELVQIWLFDTGASDLLINFETEQSLKTQGILVNDNYLGTGEYEMANGQVDTCRKYKINSIQIGDFSVNNLIVAVTDKGRKNILGKSLLNKFQNWEINNKSGHLILRK
ncbi:MAG: clan AA aspartic protease [Lacibacter sp.]|jgi:hypothetical protein